MRFRVPSLFLMPALIIMVFFLTGCDEKATEPKEQLDVTNQNPHCGLVAGFIRNASGGGLSEATVAISPVPSTGAKTGLDSHSLSSFINYPNPFTSDTYFAYYLVGTEPYTVTISIYDLHKELQRSFSGAPGAQGANLLHFDGLDDQEEALSEGLYPCRVVVQSSAGTDSLRIAISKGVNISDEGGLQSYTVTTASDGKYIIAEVPLNILLQTTTTFAPDQDLAYPQNWPYVETSWHLTDGIIVTASKPGYSTTRDTVNLSPGAVTRLDLTLQ